jgi:hypothetical protein
MRRVIAVALVLLPAWAYGDEVILKSGRRIVGVVVERTPEMVFMEVGPGRIGFPMSKVERIEITPSELDEYRRRASRIAGNDAAAWLDLGFWARDRGLMTQARRAFERVLTLDPNHAGAHAALGDVRTGSGWTSSEEVRRSEAAAESAARDQRERAEHAAASAEADRAAAEARAREAEARAREAAAERRAAEHEDAAAAASPYGQPYPPGPGFVPVVPVNPGWNDPQCQGPCGAPTPAPAATPVPPPRDGPRHPVVTPTPTPDPPRLPPITPSPRPRKDGVPANDPH